MENNVAHTIVGDEFQKHFLIFVTDIVDDTC